MATPPGRVTAALGFHQPPESPDAETQAIDAMKAMAEALAYNNRTTSRGGGGGGGGETIVGEDGNESPPVTPPPSAMKTSAFLDRRMTGPSTC